MHSHQCTIMDRSTTDTPLFLEQCMLSFFYDRIAICADGEFGLTGFSVFYYNLQDPRWFKFTVCEVKKPWHSVSK